MFQSIEFIRWLPHEEFGIPNDHTSKYWTSKYWECELTDSEFGTIKIDAFVERPVFVWLDDAEVIIKEYSKRKLNVEANLISYFCWYDDGYEFSVSNQIKLAEKHLYPLYPEIKERLQKYLTLL